MQCLAEDKVWKMFIIFRKFMFFKRKKVTHLAQNLTSRRKMPYRTHANHVIRDAISLRGVHQNTVGLKMFTVLPPN